MGPPSSVCVPTFFSVASSSSQAPLQQRHSLNSDCPSLASEGAVPRSSEPLGGSSSRPTHASRSAQTVPCPPSTPEPPHATASCVETVERFARHLGLSLRPVQQLSLCRRPSLWELYQHRWEVYRCWCADWGHSVSSPTIAKSADFLFFLQRGCHLWWPRFRALG